MSDFWETLYEGSSRHLEISPLKALKLIQIVYERNQLSRRDHDSEFIHYLSTFLSSSLHKAIQFLTRSFSESLNISLFDFSVSHIISWLQSVVDKK